MLIHTVQTGDTIETIATQYNLPVSKIIADNSLTPNSILNLGQAIMIVPPDKTYIVEEGDTPFSVAERNGISILELLRNNPQLSDKSTLTAGDELVISYKKEESIDVFGYSTAFVTEQVLRKTLPFLTYLSIFNYRADALGSLSNINDENIIRLALEYGVAPIMFLSAMTETGQGSYATTHAIINNLEVQNLLLDNVIMTMKMKGYVGVDLAFYSVIQEDLPKYLDMVTRYTKRLNQEGYIVFVTLTPHTIGYKAGVKADYSYFAKFGSVANKVILISYLWQQATIPQVSETTYGYYKELLDYVVTQIPPEKIFISLTRIAYDWELPYVEGETPGTSLTNAGAINLANQLGSVIYFDEPTQTSYFYYNSTGIDHFVWFKDARSAIAILNLVKEYGLSGVAVWNIVFYYSPTWVTINSLYNINSYDKDNV